MARAAPGVNVTPSVVDRLLDLEPSLAVDPPVSRSQSLRQLKISLRRDLEWLLNTRRNPEPPPEGSQELERSLYNYGLPDVAAMGIHSVTDQKRLLRMLEATVSLFEPRIAGAVVSMEPVAGNSRVLRFQIQGLLMVDPAPEKVAFDTLLELTRGEYEVRAE
jgi:type VI secretion system protein ImpF